MFTVLSRRTLFGFVTVALLGTGGTMASPATDFVSNFGQRLVAIVNSDQPLTEKKKQVLPLLQENLDIPGIGRYCLGRYWRSATPDQQKKYLSLFDQVLVNTITDHIGNYQGVHFHISGSAPTADGERVNAIIDRPGQPEVNMQLVIAGTPPKVIDMFGEGASLRMNQRGDYSSYLSRHGGDLDALNTALAHQLSHHH